MTFKINGARNEPFSAAMLGIPTVSDRGCTECREDLSGTETGVAIPQ